MLGVAPSASDEELHDAYRRLVKQHHPDRNGGSEESTRRFQEIQQAYDAVRRLRAGGAQPRSRPAPAPDDPVVESRMADLERELREAQAARERARQAARDAMRETIGRPSDEELGYVTTDDSFTKILGDVRDELSGKLSDARQHPAARRVSDLIEGLERLTRYDGKK